MAGKICSRKEDQLTELDLIYNLISSSQLKLFFPAREQNYMYTEHKTTKTNNTQPQ